MKSLLGHILIRIVIGLCIGALGFVIGFFMSNMSIFYDWFGMAGMGLIVLGGIMVSPQGRRGSFYEDWAVGNDMSNSNRQSFNRGLSGAITLVIIGATVFLCSILGYVLMR